MEKRKISTGSAEFDKWLFGGYETNIITTLYGPAGSGKTNLCLMAAARQAAQATCKKVVFVDTEGGLSIERLKQLIRQDVEAIMKNILLLKATNFAEQKEAFDKLLKLINKNSDIGLIIVDSMVMLYRLELGQANQQKDQDKVKEINRNLAKQMRILNEIARKKKIPVLVTNQVYSQFLSREELEEGKQPGVSMVGGDILKYWSKCIIELQNFGQNRKKAILRKHRSLPEKEFIFTVYDSGIKEKRFRLF